jgi:alginate O-acetyltransferase complex protein AlgI
MMNYLYIPLGGNKSGMVRTLGNLLIVFIVSGIWHGAGWLFLLWGGLHGLGILINRVWSKVVLKKYPSLELPYIPAVIITFFFVNLFWVFFRATTLQRAYEIICSMFNFANASGITKPFRNAIEEHGFDKDLIFVVSGIAIFIAFALPNSFEMNEKLKKHPYFRMILTVVFATIGFLCIGRLSPFLYFNF